MKYHGQVIGPNQVACWVDYDNGTRRLAHQVHHSPDGMAWGYEGSGPADLARSILTDYLGSIPSQSLYQAFKVAFVAQWPRNEPWKITSEQIKAWLVTQ